MAAGNTELLGTNFSDVSHECLVSGQLRRPSNHPPTTNGNQSYSKNPINKRRTITPLESKQHTASALSMAMRMSQQQEKLQLNIPESTYLPPKGKKIIKKTSKKRLQQLSKPKLINSRLKHVSFSPERVVDHERVKKRYILPLRSNRLAKLSAPRRRVTKYKERKFKILDEMDDKKLLTRALKVQRKEAKEAANRLIESMDRIEKEHEDSMDKKKERRGKKKTFQQQQHYDEDGEQQCHPLTARNFGSKENPQSPSASQICKIRPSSAPSTPKLYDRRALRMEKEITNLCDEREQIIYLIKESINDGTYVDTIDHHTQLMKIKKLTYFSTF